jgi:hypothetical protein
LELGVNTSINENGDLTVNGGIAGNRLATNGDLQMQNNGSGVVWGNNYSKIYDDGNLHIDTDDLMYIKAPNTLNIDTPNLNINTSGGKMCIQYGPANQYKFCFQNDGHVVQYKNDNAVWWTGKYN